MSVLCERSSSSFIQIRNAADTADGALGPTVNTTPIAMLIYFRPDHLGQNTTLLTMGGTGRQVWKISYDSSTGQILFQGASTLNFSSLVSLTSSDLDKWHIVAITWNGTGTDITAFYKNLTDNGAIQSQTVSPHSDAGSAGGSPKIGQHSIASIIFRGTLAHAGYWVNQTAAMTSTDFDNIIASGGNAATWESGALVFYDPLITSSFKINQKLTSSNTWSPSTGSASYLIKPSGSPYMDFDPAHRFLRGPQRS